MSLFEKEIEKIQKKRFDIFELDVSGFCDKVASRKRATDQQKVDAMLELDATLYMYLGSDSKKSERRETKKKSRIIYRAIKNINYALGDSLLSHQDRHDP